jgi:hypothetical protein
VPDFVGPADVVHIPLRGVTHSGIATAVALLPRQTRRAATQACGHNSLREEQKVLLRGAAAVDVRVEGARVGQVVVEFVGVRVHGGQMRQSVLMVEQRRPVKRFLTEFGGKFWRQVGDGVDDPDDDVDAARRRADQKKKEITEGRSMTRVIAEAWGCEDVEMWFDGRGHRGSRLGIEKSKEHRFEQSRERHRR